MILVSPQTAENVGAVARVMNNFGCRDLAVVDARCDIDPSGRAGVMACWSEEILATARKLATLDEALSDCVYSVALTMMESEDRPVEFAGLVPRVLLAGRPENEMRALIFGREDRGLTNEECSRASARWKIPTNPEAPSMNLAQAVAVALAGVAEASAGTASSEGGETEDAATHGEIDGLMKHLEQLLKSINYDRSVPVEQTLRQLRRAALRAPLRLNEVRTLRGICRRALNELLGYERRK